MSNNGQKPSKITKSDFTSNEYLERGAYHVNLQMSRNWLPIYFRRNFIVEKILQDYYNEETVILDLGCGEGVIVSNLRKKKLYNTFGLDYYAPFICEKMIRGDVLNIPIANESVEVVIYLDILEHIPLHLQEITIFELTRVMKSGGIALISVPNMAHLRSRIGFFFKGIPWRNKLRKHPGELSVYERLRIFRASGLELGDWIGLHFPLSMDPAPPGFKGKILTRLMFNPLVPPGFCFSCVLLLYKTVKPEWLNFRQRRLSPLRKALSTYKPNEKDPTFRIYNRF